MTRGGVRVIGAGGHAKVVIATLQAAGFDVEAAFDDEESKWGRSILDVRIEGGSRSAVGGAGCVIAVGENHVRKRIAEDLDAEWVTAVHPGACVHPSVRLGRGVVICAGAVVQPDVVVGDHVIVNTGATVDHDAVLGNFVHIAPGAHLAGGVRVDEGALVGVGSAVLPAVHIGAWATLGAGAVAVADVSDGAVARGVPARIVERSL